MTAHLSQDLIATMQGTLTDGEVAAKHGLSAAEVRLAREAYLSGLADATRRTPRRGRALGLTAAAIAALLLMVGARNAIAGTCATPSGFPVSLGLVPFCANEAALASEANTNTTTLVNLMQQKVGTLGNNVVDLGARVKFCATSPCYCDSTNERAITWTGTCANAGHAIYEANFVTQAGTNLRGFDMRCFHVSSFNVVPGLNMQILCARVALP